MNKDEEQNIKYLIVGTGRNGSSLLSAILNGAGADFGIEFREDWDPKKGAFEQDNLHKAYKWYSRARNIKNSNIPEFFGYSFCDNKCNEFLERALQRADFLKSSKLIWLVHKISYELGYSIKIIGLYRSFSNYVISRYKKFGVSFEKWREVYLKVNRQLLLYNYIFDTQLIGYEKLVNLEEVECVEKLSDITKISKEKINKFRNKLVKEGIVKDKIKRNLETKDTINILKKLKKL